MLLRQLCLTSWFAYAQQIFHDDAILAWVVTLFDFRCISQVSLDPPNPQLILYLS